MESEILKLLLESASGTTVIAVGLWFIISRMRNNKTSQDYVTKSTFYETVKESREISEARHTDVLTSIDTWGNKIEAAAETDRKNLFTHVSNHD